jgi:peptide/nickel transport system permease protein
MFACILLAAVAGLLVSPHDSIGVDFLNRFQGPSAAHWGGTDEYGRDIFTRTAAGAFTSLHVSALAVAAAILAGVLLGTLMGWCGGWVDRLGTVVVDSILAFPGLLLVLGIMTALGPGRSSVVLALSIAYMPVIARIVRGTVYDLKYREFVEASRFFGNGPLAIILRHVLPNTTSPLIIISSTIFTAAILSETALSFLGLGVPPQAPSWGGMLADSRTYLALNAWMAIVPGTALVLTLLSVNLVGEGLRDLLGTTSSPREMRR